MEKGKGEYRMRQKEIAGWLKGITMVLAVMGLVFFLVLLFQYID